MKIALISINMYSKELNFACLIHTYAFQQFLLRNGIETTVLNYKPVSCFDFDLEHPYDYYKECYDKLCKSASEKATDELRDKLVKLEKKCDVYGHLYKEREMRYRRFQDFIDSKYIKTDVCYNSDTLEITDPGFDCYICVTDVIWKYNPGEGFDRGFFLGSTCMDGKWKIAYAASRGVPPTYTPSQEAQFLSYVNDLDVISVREKSLQCYIESHTDRDVELVLDPVLLNDRSFYENMAINPKEKGYIVLYYVMERAADTIRMAVDYARAHSLKIVELTDFPHFKRSDQFEGAEKAYRCDVGNDIGVEEWLGYIKEAECVFTNSFHGVCFSILFERKFYVGKRNGDKVTNLLETVGLSSQRVLSYREIEEKQDVAIDYDSVNAALEVERRASERFILGAIKACEEGALPEKGSTALTAATAYPLIYHSGGGQFEVSGDWSAVFGSYTVENLPSGNVQIKLETLQPNDGTAVLAPGCFVREGRRFAGWRLRLRIDKQWFWLLQDGGLVSKEEGAFRAAVFPADEAIPHVPVRRIATMVAEAVWESEEYIIRYNSGRKASDGRASYKQADGEVKHLSSGSMEYTPKQLLSNDGDACMEANGFSYPKIAFAGWRVRMKERGVWYWLLEDGAVAPVKGYTDARDGRCLVIADRGCLPHFAAHDVEVVVAEAQWRERTGLGERMRGMLRLR